MNNYKITDRKKACFILAALFWGLLIGIELFGNKILFKLFPRELLLRYIDVVFYGSFFLVIVIVFWKSFWCAIKDFVRNYEKYVKWIVSFVIITLILMVALAIILDSVGVGDSANQQTVEESIAQYGILQIITVCFIGPVVEEFFYRGIVFDVLKGRKKSVIRSIVAVLLAALFFALIHVSFSNFTFIDLLANLPVFALGLTLAILYWKTDNILCPILVHIVINSISTFG